MKNLVSLLLLVVSFMHLLPVTGVLGSDSINRLYGVTASDSNTEILLRHRAVLFAIVGLFLLLSVFKSDYQPLGILIGLVSVASFILLAWSAEGLNAEMSRVVKIDWIALLLLIVAGAITLIV